MATERKKKETEALPWKHQLINDSILKANKGFPYIIPEAVESKSQEVLQIFFDLKAYIQKFVDEPNKVAWFDPCRPMKMRGRTLIIWTPSEKSNFWADYINQSFGYQLDEFIKASKLDAIEFTPYRKNTIEFRRDY